MVAKNWKTRFGQIWLILFGFDVQTGKLTAALVGSMSAFGNLVPPQQKNTSRSQTRGAGPWRPDSPSQMEASGTRCELVAPRSSSQWSFSNFAVCASKDPEANIPEPPSGATRNTWTIFMVNTSLFTLGSTSSKPQKRVGGVSNRWTLLDGVKGAKRNPCRLSGVPPFPFLQPLKAAMVPMETTRRFREDPVAAEGLVAQIRNALQNRT